MAAVAVAFVWALVLFIVNIIKTILFVALEMLSTLFVLCGAVFSAIFTAASWAFWAIFCIVSIPVKTIAAAVDLFSLYPAASWTVLASLVAFFIWRSLESTGILSVPVSLSMTVSVRRAQSPPLSSSASVCRCRFFV